MFENELHKEIFDYVENLFIESNKNHWNGEIYIFRTRSEHIKRVYKWTGRLTEGLVDINTEALKIAALFHDVGYCIQDDKRPHALVSKELCTKYLFENGFDESLIEQIAYLVENHSNKELMEYEDIKIELLLLMESDLMDESGAMSVVWDCMAEGAKDTASFNSALEHIKEFTIRDMKRNPMKTDKAKTIWSKKQMLVNSFIDHLEYDL